MMRKRLLQESFMFRLSPKPTRLRVRRLGTMACLASALWAMQLRGVAAEPAATLPEWTLVPAAESGLGSVNAMLKWPWISSAVDANGDGHLDFCVYGHHGLTEEFRDDKAGGSGFWYLNDGKGKFTPVRGWKGMGTIQGWWYDFTNDGILDMIGYEAAFGHWFANNGKGEFVSQGKIFCSGPVDADGDGIFQEFSKGGRGNEGKGAEPAGIYRLEPPVASMTGDSVKAVPKLLWDWKSLGVDIKDELPEARGTVLNVRDCCDLDGDSVNDLVVWRHTYIYGEATKIADVAMRSWVLLGRKDGPPELANEKLGLPSGGRHAFVPTDLNRDGFLDVLDIHSGEIFLSDGRGKFVKSDKRLFPDAPEWKNTVFAGDGAEELADYGNAGIPAFRVESAHGYASGKNAGLFVHDGDLDFTRAPTPAWARAAGNSSFYISSGDFDNDGDADVVVIKGQKEALYFRNEGLAGNHYLRVRPIQKTPCNSAMGCKLWVYQAGKMGEKDGLIGYTQARMKGRVATTVIHMGLGEAAVADLRLQFPVSGKVVELKGIKADQVVKVQED